MFDFWPWAVTEGYRSARRGHWRATASTDMAARAALLCYNGYCRGWFGIDGGRQSDGMQNGLHHMVKDDDKKLQLRGAAVRKLRWQIEAGKPR